MTQSATPTPQSLQPVSGADGVWLQDQSTNLMVINAVFTFDRMEIEDFRRVFSERLLGEPGNYRYPRFAQKVVPRGSGYVWQDDPDFDLERHIFLAPPLEDDPAALDNKEKLQAYVAEQASRSLPEDRPLWQFLFVPNFGDGECAFFTRVHHVMGDGIAMVQVLFSLMDAGSEGGQVMPAVVDRGGKPPNKLLLGLHASLAGPLILGQKMLWKPDRSSVHGPTLSGDKRVAWTPAISLEGVKAIKNRFGATVNDVLVACVAGAFRRYALSRGEDPKRLQVSMPVNVRSSSEELVMDNKFAAVMLALPLDVADGVERLTETKRRLDKLKRSVEPVSTYGIVNVMLKTLPFRWSAGLIDFFANKCSIVLSNVPGPQNALYVAGHRLRAMLFWVPQRATVGVGVSIISFDGNLRMGVMGDTALVDDPGELVEAFQAELAALESVG